MTKINKPAFAWALYDWANSVFAVTVLTGFFPIFLKTYWAGDLSASESTFYLGLITAAASLVVMVLAPVLGVVADRGNRQKLFLLFFAVAGAITCAGLYAVQQGHWHVALSLYLASVICFYSANVFYDALLTSVSDHQARHRVSALGFSLGYLGGGLLFLVCVIMTLNPTWFGLADAAQAIRISFLLSGIWWLVFTLPLLIWVEQTPSKDESAKRQTLQQLKQTALDIWSQKPIALFLLAYWLYIDGVATIIRMAVDFGLAIGFDSTDLIKAILIVQFIGFPAAIVFGRIGERYGAKRGLWIGLWVYVITTIFAALMTQEIHFYILAIMIGLVQGGVQSLSRSLFSRLIPQQQSARYFGFYNIMGKSAALIGPLLVGVVALFTENARLSVIAILILFFAGMWVLKYVDETKPSTD